MFTDYVASLGEAGDPPDRESFDRIWRALKTTVRTELRRRGLWTSPPRYLGVVGAEAWNEEALDELVADAYVFNFVDRLRSMRAQLEVKTNVEGLVSLNVKNFLYERQRRHDPLGCRLFATLRTALLDLVEAGELEVASGDPEIRNDTVLHFPRGIPSAERLKARPPPAPSFEDLTASWSDDLLPELVTARAGRLETVTAELRERIRTLPDQGCGSFTVKELVNPFKTAVRERWHALHARDAGAPEDAAEGDELFGDVRRRYRPDEELEDAEAFEKLTDCVERQLRKLDKEELSGEYLNLLWQFLRVHAVGEHDLPSRRKLAEHLGIPRNRFPELYETLGVLLERCRKLLFEPPVDREGGTQ